MAGPMKWFRKHRKLMMAILTIMAMFSFVFFGYVGDILSVRGRARDLPVVTTKKYGDLRESQVAALVWQRGRWLVFLQDLQTRVLQNKGRPFLYPERNPLFLVVGQAAYPLGPETEQSVVETWLLSRKARDIGIAISNEAINRFLADLTGGSVGDAELKGMLKPLRLSQSALFEIARNELSAMSLRQMLTMHVGDVTPAQRWDYFQRLNRMAKIELVPIDAQKLIATIADPTEQQEADLKALFEQYKDRRPDPESPEPGFREPHRIALEYFKAELTSVQETIARSGKLAASSPWALDLALRGVIGVESRNDFLDPDEVTEAEIAAYYDEHKAAFAEPVAPEAKPLPEKPPAPPQKKPPEPAKPAAPKAEPAKPEPHETPPGQEPPSPTGPPKSELPHGPLQKPGPAGKGPIKTSSANGVFEPPVRMASFQKEESGLPSPKAGGAAKEAGGAAKEAGGAAKEAEGTPGKSPPPVKVQPAPRPTYEVPPLEKVKHRIRELLARQKAHDKITVALAALQDEMARFEREWMAYQSLEKSRKEATSPPRPPNLDATAEKLRLKPARTGVIAERDAGQWDISRARVEGSVPFAQRAFGALALYRAVTGQDPEGNEYLFWKLEDHPERVPNWEDQGVRERVVRAWKLIQAREVALAEADDLVARARKTKKPLQEVVGKKLEAEVLAPPPFSWLVSWDRSRGFGGERLVLGAILGADKAPIAWLGNAFMEKLFALPPGGVDRIWNNPQTVVYVVRVVQYLPLETTLWEEFLVTPWQAYSQAAALDQEAGLAAWKQDLFAEAGLQWKREPERRGPERPTGEEL